MQVKICPNPTAHEKRYFEVYDLGVEEGDARAKNAYYRCGCGCTLLIYVARRVYYIVPTLF